MSPGTPEVERVGREAAEALGNALRDLLCTPAPHNLDAKFDAYHMHSVSCPSMYNQGRTVVVNTLRQTLDAQGEED